MLSEPASAGHTCDPSSRSVSPRSESSGLERSPNRTGIFSRRKEWRRSGDCPIRRRASLEVSLRRVTEGRSNGSVASLSEAPSPQLLLEETQAVPGICRSGSFTIPVRTLSLPAIRWRLEKLGPGDHHQKARVSQTRLFRKNCSFVGSSCHQSPSASTRRRCVLPGMSLAPRPGSKTTV